LWHGESPPSASSFPPFVSVLVPVRNERLYIGESLLSLLSQDYDRDRFEILVVDDHSRDSTSEIVRALAKNDTRIQLFINQSVGTPSARNFALVHSKGSVIVNFSGHAIASESLLSTLVSKLLMAHPTLAGVGCTHEMPTDEPCFARVARLALSTYLGGIASTYRQHNSERFLLSIAFTAYRREVFDAVGGFDESMKPMGEDLEFNLRLKEAGYRLLYTPDTTVYHREVRSITKFVRHMFLFGLARGIATLKHPRSFNPVHVVPSLLVLVALAWLGSLILKGHSPQVLVAILLGYFLSCLGSALATGASIELRLIGPLALMYAILHFSYGTGYLATLLVARSYLGHSVSPPALLPDLKRRCVQEPDSEGLVLGSSRVSLGATNPRL